MGLPNSLSLQRSPGDEIPRKISLEGFVYDPRHGDDMERWNAFLERCRARTAEHNDKGKTMYERVFGTSYDESSDLRPEK